MPPFIIPTKKREMAKNSYEGESPFAMANKMSRAKPGKQGKRFYFRRLPNKKQNNLSVSLLDAQWHLSQVITVNTTGLGRNLSS